MMQSKDDYLITMKTLLLTSLLVLIYPCSYGQQVLDSTLNNLILPQGYKPGELNAIPQYSKSGKGKTTLILIPGFGFDKSVFDDFVKANRKLYTMYAITIPGYGNTQSPPVPSQGTSFGECSWNMSALQGIVKLMDQEKIDKPIVVGHFVQGTQLAFQLAIRYPDKVAGVVSLAGPTRFILIQNGKPSIYGLKSRIAYADSVMGPKFYKWVTKSFWDQNNYIREMYSFNSKTADLLWNQSAAVPLPIMARYLIEFQVTDVTLEVGKIKCPVLVLRPGFRQDWLDDTQNGSFNFIKPQFIDEWDKMREKNQLIHIKDIPESAAFLWKDQPEKTYQHLKDFVKLNFR
jgi:pimeloyl-ACP methyl ester carboxylesterase